MLIQGFLKDDFELNLKGFSIRFVNIEMCDVTRFSMLLGYKWGIPIIISRFLKVICTISGNTADPLSDVPHTLKKVYYRYINEEAANPICSTMSKFDLCKGVKKFAPSERVENNLRLLSKIDLNETQFLHT